MHHDIDWPSIKKDYEQGMSLRSLSTHYGPGKSTIHERALAEQWTRPDVTRTPDIQPRRTSDKKERTSSRTSPRTEPEQPPDPTTVDLARVAIGQLSDIAKVPMDLKEHTLFAQALSQYNKVIVTAPQEQELPRGVDFSIFTEQELSVIQPIFAIAEARERERQKNIIPIRREA